MPTPQPVTSPLTGTAMNYAESQIKTVGDLAAQARGAPLLAAPQPVRQPVQPDDGTTPYNFLKSGEQFTEDSQGDFVFLKTIERHKSIRMGDGMPVYWEDLAPVRRHAPAIVPPGTVIDPESPAALLASMPAKKQVIHQRVLDCLNSVFAADPNALHCLMANYIPCNQALADDQHVIVDSDKAIGAVNCRVSTLGLLNGVLSAIGLPVVASQWDTDYDPPRLLGFCQYNPPTHTDQPAPSQGAAHDNPVPTPDPQHAGEAQT